MMGNTIPQNRQNHQQQHQQLQQQQLQSTPETTTHSSPPPIDIANPTTNANINSDDSSTSATAPSLKDASSGVLLADTTTMLDTAPTSEHGRAEMFQTTSLITPGGTRVTIPMAPSSSSNKVVVVGNAANAIRSTSNHTIDLNVTNNAADINGAKGVTNGNDCVANATSTNSDECDVDAAINATDIFMTLLRQDSKTGGKEDTTLHNNEKHAEEGGLKMHSSVSDGGDGDGGVTNGVGGAALGDPSGISGSIAPSSAATTTVSTTTNSSCPPRTKKIARPRSPPTKNATTSSTKNATATTVLKPLGDRTKKLARSRAKSKRPNRITAVEEDERAHSDDSGDDDEKDNEEEKEDRMEEEHSTIAGVVNTKGGGDGNGNGDNALIQSSTESHTIHGGQAHGHTATSVNYVRSITHDNDDDDVDKSAEMIEGDGGGEGGAHHHQEEVAVNKDPNAATADANNANLNLFCQTDDAVTKGNDDDVDNGAKIITGNDGGEDGAHRHQEEVTVNDGSDTATNADDADLNLFHQTYLEMTNDNDDDVDNGAKMIVGDNAGKEAHHHQEVSVDAGSNSPMQISDEGEKQNIGPGPSGAAGSNIVGKNDDNKNLAIPATTNDNILLNSDEVQTATINAQTILSASAGDCLDALQKNDNDEGTSPDAAVAETALFGLIEQSMHTISLSQSDKPKDMKVSLPQEAPQQEPDPEYAKKSWPKHKNGIRDSSDTGRNNASLENATMADERKDSDRVDHDSNEEVGAGALHSNASKDDVHNNPEQRNIGTVTHNNIQTEDGENQGNNANKANSTIANKNELHLASSSPTAGNGIDGRDIRNDSSDDDSLFSDNSALIDNHHPITSQNNVTLYLEGNDDSNGTLLSGSRVNDQNDAEKGVPSPVAGVVNQTQQKDAEIIDEACSSSDDSLFSASAPIDHNNHNDISPPSDITLCVPIENPQESECKDYDEDLFPPSSEDNSPNNETYRNENIESANETHCQVECLPGQDETALALEIPSAEPGKKDTSQCPPQPPNTKGPQSQGQENSDSDDSLFGSDDDNNISLPPAPSDPVINQAQAQPQEDDSDDESLFGPSDYGDVDINEHSSPSRLLPIAQQNLQLQQSLQQNNYTYVGEVTLNKDNGFQQEATSNASNSPLQDSGGDNHSRNQLGFFDPPTKAQEDRDSEYDSSDEGSIFSLNDLTKDNDNKLKMSSLKSTKKCIPRKTASKGTSAPCDPLSGVPTGYSIKRKTSDSSQMNVRNEKPMLHKLIDPRLQQTLSLSHAHRADSRSINALHINNERVSSEMKELARQFKNRDLDQSHQLKNAENEENRRGKTNKVSFSEGTFLKKKKPNQFVGKAARALKNNDATHQSNSSGYNHRFVDLSDVLGETKKAASALTASEEACARTTDKYLENQWNKNFLKMKHYIQERKHCDVPYGHSLEPWIKRERNVCKRWVRKNRNDMSRESSTLVLKTLTHISRLNGIGFDWGLGITEQGVRETISSMSMMLSPSERRLLSELEDELSKESINARAPSTSSHSQRKIKERIARVKSTKRSLAFSNDDTKARKKHHSSDDEIEFEDSDDEVQIINVTRSKKENHRKRSINHTEANIGNDGISVVTQDSVSSSVSSPRRKRMNANAAASVLISSLIGNSEDRSDDGVDDSAPHEDDSIYNKQAPKKGKKDKKTTKQRKGSSDGNDSKRASVSSMGKKDDPSQEAVVSKRGSKPTASSSFDDQGCVSYESSKICESSKKKSRKDKSSPHDTKSKSVPVECDQQCLDHLKELGKKYQFNEQLLKPSTLESNRMALLEQAGFSREDDSSSNNINKSTTKSRPDADTQHVYSTPGSTGKEKSKNRSNVSPPTLTKSDQKWHGRLQEWQEFNRSSQGLEPPREMKLLSNWVRTQRTEYRFLSEGKKSSMTSTRIQVLEQAGFAWAKTKSKSPVSSTKSCDAVPNVIVARKQNDGHNDKTNAKVSGNDQDHSGANSSIDKKLEGKDSKELLKEGDRVYAAWWPNEKKKGPASFFPGVIKQIKEFENGQHHMPLLSFRIVFDDGQVSDNIDESEIIPRHKYLQKSLKPTLEVGTKVYAAWWPTKKRTGAPAWYPGTVKSYKEAVGGEYGPIRFYNVHFDDGDDLDDIEEFYVFLKEEYLLSMRKLDGNSESEWIGVKNVLDRKSIDKWAKIVGWYVASIDGQEQPFSLLSNALRAYDDHVVCCKGAKTERCDLNLPEEWNFLPKSCGKPTRINVSNGCEECLLANDDCKGHTQRKKKRTKTESNRVVKKKAYEPPSYSNLSCEDSDANESHDASHKPASSKNDASSLAIKHSYHTKKWQAKERSAPKHDNEIQSSKNDKSKSSVPSRMSSSLGKELRYKVVESPGPSQKQSTKEHGYDDAETSEDDGDERELISPITPLSTNQRTKPLINKGDKVYALWTGGKGRKNWYPGHVWDITPVKGESGYGPKKTYDIVYDDGDTDTQLDEIYVMKKDDYEINVEKDEDQWIGVTNFIDDKSEDDYARTVGWYDTHINGVLRVYSSLGDALRAHDKHVIESKGRENVLDSELNFPEDHY